MNKHTKDADMPTLRILRNRLRITLRYYALRMDLLGLRIFDALQITHVPKVKSVSGYFYLLKRYSLLTHSLLVPPYGGQN